MENLSVKLDSSQEASVFSFNFPKVSIFILKSSIFMECELLDNETTNSKKKKQKQQQSYYESKCGSHKTKG